MSIELPTGHDPASIGDAIVELPEGFLVMPGAVVRRSTAFAGRHVVRPGTMLRPGKPISVEVLTKEAIVSVILIPPQVSRGARLSARALLAMAITFAVPAALIATVRVSELRMPPLVDTYGGMNIGAIGVYEAFVTRGSKVYPEKRERDPVSPFETGAADDGSKEGAR